MWNLFLFRCVCMDILYPSVKYVFLYTGQEIKVKIPCFKGLSRLSQDQSHSFYSLIWGVLTRSNMKIKIIKISFLGSWKRLFKWGEIWKEFWRTQLHRRISIGRWAGKWYYRWLKRWWQMLNINENYLDACQNADLGVFHSDTPIQ